MYYPNKLSEIKKSLHVALPLMASNIVQASSGFIGTLMVAHLGKATLAAAALGSSVYFTLIVFFFGILGSLSIIVAQNHGAKNKTGIQGAVSQGIILAFITTIPMMLIVYFVPLALPYFGQNPLVTKLATQYMHAATWCILPLSILYILEQFLVGISKSRLVLWISIIQVPFEILFTYAFIFGKFGLPKCGLAGIGYGFALVFTIGATWVGFFIHYSKTCRFYEPFAKLGQWHKKYLKELVNIGWPMGCMYVVEVATLAIIAFWMGKIGDTQLAAYQLARQFLMMGMMIIFAITQATSVRVGQEYGAKNTNGMKMATFANILIGLVCTSLIGLVFIIWPKSLLAIDINIHHQSLQSLIHYAVVFLAINAIILVGDGYRFIITGALRGQKDTMVPMYISMIGYWLIGLACAYLFAFVLNLHGNGLLLGLLCATAFCATTLTRRQKKMIAKISW